MRVARSSETVAPYVPTSLAEADAPAAVSQPVNVSAFANLLKGLGSELDRGEAIAERAIHAGGAGARLSPEQLLALQAGIYRYSEAIDLVTKVVDRATQAVKTTLQSQ
jgi:hypothetical protein